uniref:Uncharacterized protein n=1 Tax=Anguilla anguilla TaxID=7936 RepID=A0A0E9WMW2_ANGAN
MHLYVHPLMFYRSTSQEQVTKIGREAHVRNPCGGGVLYSVR